MRIWTLFIDAAGERSIEVFTTEEELWDEVRGEAEKAQQSSTHPMPEDREMWAEYIEDNGWQVRTCEITEHEIEVPE